MCRRKSKRYSSPLRLEDAETIGVDSLRRDLRGTEVLTANRTGRQVIATDFARSSISHSARYANGEITSKYHDAAGGEVGAVVI